LMFENEAEDCEDEVRMARRHSFIDKSSLMPNSS
jgi:hypothetical protein